MVFTKNQKLFIGAIVTILILSFICVSLKNKERTESFGDVIGAAGEFRNQYFTCLNQCEKTDPTERRSQNPWKCGMYCDDVVTRSVAAEKQLGNLVSVEDFCEEQCKGSTNNLDCQAKCGCDLNTEEYCRQQCKYSPLGLPECLSACLSLERVNCIGGNSWTWRPI